MPGIKVKSSIETEVGERKMQKYSVFFPRLSIRLRNGNDSLWFVSFRLIAMIVRVRKTLTILQFLEMRSIHLYTISIYDTYTYGSGSNVYPIFVFVCLYTYYYNVCIFFLFIPSLYGC